MAFTDRRLSCVKTRPYKPGSEEYLNSEKYELKHRDLTFRVESAGLYCQNQPNSQRESRPCKAITICAFMIPIIRMLICYSKTTDDLTNVIVVIVNLDSFHTPDRLD